MAVKVAIIGARGIGKQHAKWFAFEGADVVAFAGSRPENLNSTAEAMRQLFGFGGKGYTDVEKMLHKERPDAVSICSPHALHYQHTLQALDYGAHVLCEKPLVWYYEYEDDGNRMLKEAAEMVEAARRVNRLLAVNTQYVALVPYYAQLYEPARGHCHPIEHVDICMESRLHGRDDSGEAIWVDLGSHPISVLLRWLPDFQIDSNSLKVQVEERAVTVRFTARSVNQHQPPANCSIVVGRTEKSALERSFGINGFLVHISGRNDESGVYRSSLRWEGGEQLCEDFMHTSIKRFLQAVQGKGEVLCSGEEGLKNLERQVAILLPLPDARSKVVV